jgi:hypothetical protein
VNLAVDLLAAAAPLLNITVVSRDGEYATFEVPVSPPSGRLQVFRVRATGAHSPAAREVEGLLPSFCPERHINHDGTFCLGWGDDAAPAVVDVDSAEVWWGLVLDFLRLQMRAARARKWTGPGWAHGSAAVHQLAAEKAAEKLGADVLDDLRQRRIQVNWAKRRVPAGGQILKVRRRGRDWYSIWESARRVVNKQRPCVCAAGSIQHHRRLRNCRDHAEQAYELANSLLLWGEAEERFWTHFKGASCCGTLADCPLRAPSSAT